MFKLRLIRGRSYAGVVKVKAERPIIEVADKATAEFLVSTGRFALLEAPAPKDNDPGDKPIEKMTEAQLDAYAAENGIDLTGLKKKAEKLAKIQEALTPADDEDEDTGGELDFGELE